MTSITSPTSPTPAESAAPVAPPRKITPCLWFDFDAEAAVEHYTRIFPRSRVLETSRYNDATPSLKGKVLTIRFELEGEEFLALNGGPQFPFTEAVSLSVDCADQAEVDRMWTQLSEGGTEGPCGWVKDKFGLSWQIVPRPMVEMLQGPDPAGASRAVAAMMGMRKLDIAALQAAYDGS